MSKFKKAIALLLAVALTAALSVSLTMAYLQHEDRNVNVMTLGNVYINQLEYQRAEGVKHTGNLKEGDLVGFVQDQPLYPAVYSKLSDYTAESTDLLYWGSYVTAEGAGNGLWNDDLKNAMDKMIFVENTGISDCYYRTIIAFECPEGMEYSQSYDKEFMMNTNGHNLFAWEEVDYVTIDEVRYLVMVATYQAKLAPNEISRPSLLQVVMTHNATNEDMELLGDSYKILAVSQAVQTKGFDNAATALDTAFGAVNATNAVSWLGEALEEDEPDTWDGTADTTWYNDTDTEFVIMTAEQLAGFAELVDGGNTFEGKTVKLGKNIDLYYLADGAEDPTCFDPIGSYRHDKIFEGTFDGQGYTIENMSQNTWALNTGYYYGDLGLGLFGAVENATIKNLVMDNASISGESAICGTVAACAYGECTFENITVKNSEVADYQYYAGGIVGWASGKHTYKNINMDASTTVGSQWGDFGNASGGIIGGIGSSAAILFEDCTVACRIDAVNDVVSAYQWYNYRNCGMLIGQVPQTITNGEVQTVKTPENVTCKNVKVIYDDWANYTYCEFAGTGYPYVRVQAGTSVAAYSNVRYGHPTDANGNTVVDDNHVHNEGEAHHKLIVFDQLFGGPANHRYCYYGIAEYDGVTVVYNNK